MKHFLISCLVACAFLNGPASPLTAAQAGTLERVEGQRVIHLKGSPYEIGFQHGSLLKNEIGSNIDRFVGAIEHANQYGPAVAVHFLKALPKILPHIPPPLIEEMKGVAAGSGIPYDKILLLNLFPEMFHCTAITIAGNASKNGALYHVRVLDYAVAEEIQDTAVTAIVVPDNGIPFLNVTYAGFIGCITGMNKEKISIGEVGGKGYGHWDGMPMPFLLRQILQHASTIEEIKALLKETPRTCEYFYVFADGKNGTSLGVHATCADLDYFLPGEAYDNFPPLPDAYATGDNNPHEGNPPRLEQYHQPKDTLIILRNGFFDLLVERLGSSYGYTGVKELQEAIKKPVGRNSNLHNAIFAPATLDAWISHAGEDGEPAYDMPYVHYNLLSLTGD